jgi:hypothetical protein
VHGIQRCVRVSDTEYKANIYANCLSQMQLLIETASQRGLALSPGSTQHAALVSSVPSSGDSWTIAICDALMALWSDATVQQLFKTAKSELNESSSYFFESLERFRDPQGYTPTAQDVLRARVRSTGIEEAEFKVCSLFFVLFLLIVCLSTV